jgi:hypothetical protein
MDGHKSKEGVSVKEIEGFAKKHRFEVFFCLSFILACIFGAAIYSAMWLIGATVIGAIVGVLLSVKVAGFCKSVLHFVFKQEGTTQLVLGIVLLVVSIFLAPLIFLLIGLHGGKDMHLTAMEISSKSKHN